VFGDYESPRPPLDTTYTAQTARVGVLSLRALICGRGKGEVPWPADPPAAVAAFNQCLNRVIAADCQRSARAANA
jgi:hypothetical protein